jgi:nucleoside phosphorylase
MAGPENPVVVLTALPVEFLAVRALLDDTVEREHPAGTIFLEGTLRGTSRQVTLARVGKGNLGAAVIAERASTWYSPEALFFTGVAGGLSPEVALGDVVVATAIHHIHPGKEDAAGFRATPTPGAISHRLEQAAFAALQDDSWYERVPFELRETATPPPVHFAPIAAGEVVLNSLDAPLRQQISRHYADAVAIEMESAGIARAAVLTDGIRILTIRGISDHADGAKAVADAAGSQQRAAAHAAAATAAVVARAPARLGSPKPNSPSYGGDHYDFRHGVFYGPVTGKGVLPPTPD